jgi:hypothetical protein
MISAQVNLENWTFTRYRNEDLLAQISVGGRLLEKSPQDFQEIFYATVCRLDGEEIFQKEFVTLDEAIDFLNAHYGDWGFEDLILEQENGLSQDASSGCGSCQNHQNS